jgi:hypothetical protein
MFLVLLSHCQVRSDFRNHFAEGTMERGRYHCAKMARDDKWRLEQYRTDVSSVDVRLMRCPEMPRDVPYCRLWRGKECRSIPAMEERTPRCFELIAATSDC